MKHKTNLLFSFLNSRMLGLIVITVVAFVITSKAQVSQSTTHQFPIGTPVHQTLDSSNPDLLNSFIETGMNTIYHRADDDTKGNLVNYNLLAYNAKDTLEYIYHYSTAYYSKWEAEQDQTDPEKVGVKHISGQYAEWKQTPCWSTLNLTNPIGSIMYGPHYRQEKRYKRWLYGCYEGGGCVTYTPRFRMALDNSGNITDNGNVCKIKVIFTYKDRTTNQLHDYPFLERTLTVDDFNSEGEFDYFYLHQNPQLGIYEYHPNFILPKSFDLMGDPPPSIDYIDWESFTGIQFCVDWLRSDNLCTLYIDYAEVYDNAGWNNMIRFPQQTIDNITDYAESFPDTEWPNLMYWGGTDEPYTIDSYTPIHVVDQLIRSVGAPPLVVHFDPSWDHSLKVNGEDEIDMFFNIAEPEKIILGMYPCSPNWPTIRPYDFEWLRYNFQRTSALDSSFWFKAQTFGYLLLDGNNDIDWCTWRKPVPTELTSMVLLALAHGSKGITFEWFDSFPDFHHDLCASNVSVLCLVDEDGNPLSLYTTVKDTIVPRLKGKLGNTLLNLDYTQDYVQLRRYLQEEPGFNFFNTSPAETERYLTLTEYIPDSYDPPIHFHVGFFSRPGHELDNYFMLDNLITTDERKVWVTIVPPFSGYKNYRFRNVEGVFDTTFDGYSNGILKLITHTAGEGYLYQVAPVIKYGGRLLYSESTQPGMILEDDMIIESGAVLTVNGVYSSKGNIFIKNGGILNGSEGKIQFVQGKKLIIEGSGSLVGSSGNKLELVFAAPLQDETNGIQIKAGGSLTISNCKVEDAIIGIESLLNANYLNAQYVDFIDCVDNSISIAGIRGEMSPPPPPQISYCTMVNSNYGISVSNLPSILIQSNYITNTACGVYLSNVTDAQIIANQIISNREEYPGVWSLSSGGVTRANTISGHTVGIHLANSSPKLGGNNIYGNKYHGIYIGSGSIPYMRGSLAGNPPILYAVSGYNKIKENGGWEEENGPEDNDGSEIFFYNSNAIMGKGCNSIYDEREPSPPLINTLLLMNCPEELNPIYVLARFNYWGSFISSERFGNLFVDYVPYHSEPCPEPQDGSSAEMVRMTSFGEVIDTVYSTGEEVIGLTETEEGYAEAEEYFLTGDLTNALQIFEIIINSNATEEEKYFAYQKKYEIGKLTGQTSEYFNEMSNLFSSLASNAQDSLNKKILTQLSTLSKVGEQEFETAISEFDGIIQQNPNTEEAVYAELDALTTALLIEENDSTLQKGRLGKYLIKSSTDYNQKVNEILRKHFGGKSKENEKEILPTEFILYQNYPNPFNPTTTIKYDLPNTSDVSVIIYDVLGRKVKELVNTKQQAGRYEIQFNASSLASGVYIYQLIAEKYINSKKMILLK